MLLQYTDYLSQKLIAHHDQDNKNLSGELIIFGYSKEPILSIEVARLNKNAVFNSLFDIAIHYEP